jgi:hypothetical protein
MVGDTTALPPCIVYVFAPDGEMVNELPEQIEPLFTATVGFGFTETVTAVRDADVHDGKLAVIIICPSPF